ncbi:MAG TPA: hypothetical protein VGJ53_00555 [Micromonosporaceae bacterium]
MTVEKVIWTALPNGIGPDGRLRVSVHVAPRLRNDDGSDTPRKLGEFAAFGAWPDRVNSFRFLVEFQGGPSAPGIPEAAADAGLWERLFPPGTPVGPHVFRDHAKRNIHVFPVRPVLRFLEQAYGAAAAAGTNLPSIDDPFGPLAPFVPLSHIPIRITDSQSFYAELARARQDNKGDGQVVFEPMADPSLPPAAQEAQNSFFQAYRFYYRPGSQRPDFPQDHIEPSPKPHEFDFHEMLSSLADHPLLLRRLGIIIDLIVDLDPALVPAQGIVRAVPEGDLPQSPPTCPGTRYDFDGRWFGARPAHSSRMSHGLLRLSPEVYDLFQVDVDGGALQAVGFSTTLEALKDPERRSEATPDEAGIPALRSAGLALARLRRGDVLLEDLKDRRGKNADIESGHPVVFDAEDLVRGYRVDVFDEDAPGGPGWFSLHRRVVEHAIKAAEGAEPPEPIALTDEGYLKATAASSENAEHPTPSDDLYLHETIAGWEGWSLSAPRPGKRIVEPGQGDAGSSISRHDPAEGNPFPLVSRVSVEGGTLPRLRVGHTYRMRARTVDLAGNSVPFSEEELEPPEPHLVSEAQPYLRFEPLPSPAVLRRHLDTEGESLEHLAIRSNLGISPADYAELPEVKQALADAGAPHGYAEDSQRHLAPPKASQQMAEQDGRFDAAFGGTPAQVTAALRVALREEGTFLDETIVDPATGQKTIAQAPISLFPPGTALPPVRGAGLPGGAYAFCPDPNVILPYLPDPLAIGVSLTGRDFAGAEVFHQVASFPGGWPALVPFRLRLSEGPLGAAFAGGVLEVRLPKAEVVWARLASVFSDGRLEDLAIWRWVPAPDRTDALKKAAIEGRHWMLTPFREVIFTHAVQQPLVVPDMTRVKSSRALGDTFAAFRGPIVNHARSTGRLDAFGEWTEDVDLITDDEPRMRAFGTEVPHRAQAFGFDIRRSEDSAEVALHQSRHEFGDTKYRRIVYHSVATTRFREFLPRPLTDLPANIQRVEGTTDAGGTLKPGLEHHILSAARPAAPEVLYVLPTFRWERQDEGDHRKHVRRGKAVRIWLRRPWFSSGDGEQLGVILEPGVRLPRGWGRVAGLELTARDLARRPPQISIRPLRRAGGPAQPIRAVEAAAGFSGSFLTQASSPLARGAISVVAALKPTPEEIKKMLRPYVTAWGSDPVWKSATPEEPPTVAAFPRHTGYASGLTLEELPPSVAVVVAAHDVYFDRGRKLWYCDVEVDPGDTYFPFVRLALARYQSQSLAGAHLSRVVMTDFIQLAPDRAAAVVLSEASAQVTVQGFSGRSILADISPLPFQDIGPNVVGGSTTPNTTVRASLERRVPGVPGDLGWERVGSEVALQATASGFHVTWTGTVQLPPNALAGGGYRLLITELETYLRDLIPGDPMVSTSPLDFVRERVVYADTFEL